MKNIRMLPLTLTLAAGLAAFGAGCNRHERADASASAQQAYNDAKTSMSNSWDKVRAYSYDKKADFTSASKAMAADMDARLSKLRADYSDAKASASRKAAMEELKNAEADYRQKLDALGTATADTWESAKKNVIAAWDKLEAAVRKAAVN